MSAERHDQRACGARPTGTRRGLSPSGPSPSGWARSVSAGMVALLLGGCMLFNPPRPTAPEALELNRRTPEATYEYFKEMAKSNQWAAEWSVFSPNFKRLMNQSVGRNVDAGDYNLARQTLADNSQADMQLLINSKLDSVQRISDTAALVSISGGGKTLRPRMVKLTRWELKVKGDDTPYGDFVAEASEAIHIAGDGSITVRIRPPQSTASLLRTFRPDQIDSFKIEGQWYVDDFGGINQLVTERSGTAQPQAAPQAAPRPASVQPGYPQPGYPQPTSPQQPGYPPAPPPNYTTPRYTSRDAPTVAPRVPTPAVPSAAVPSAAVPSTAVPSTAVPSTAVPSTSAPSAVGAPPGPGVPPSGGWGSPDG